MFVLKRSLLLDLGEQTVKGTITIFHVEIFMYLPYHSTFLEI